MPAVSVILPTCDRPELWPRALASILRQTWIDLEVLLVDSNRRTPALKAHPALAGFLDDPRVRMISEPHAPNAAAARNVGLRAARGDWLTYLDDDDTYHPSKVERQLECARTMGAVLVLCGACFHLRGRRRLTQCGVREWRGDDLLLRARWNTPLLFHRREDVLWFDERFSPGEDAELGQRLLARAGAACVPVCGEPLVDIFPQPGARVNTNPRPVRSALATIFRHRRGFFSRGARRRAVLQMMLGAAKLQGETGRCVGLGASLLWESRGADWRAAANAFAVSFRWFPGRWVT